MKTTPLVLTTLALTLTATIPPATTAPRNDRDHTVGLSVSPIHLIFPMLEDRQPLALGMRPRI